MQRKMIVSRFLLLFLVIPNVLVAGDSYEVNSVPNQAEIDTTIRETWTGMCRALANNDMEKALTFISVQSLEHYRELFTAFGDRLPEIAREMHDIEPVYIKSNSAKYLTRKSELYGGRMTTIDYDVYFLADDNGSWKIDWF